MLTVTQGRISSDCPEQRMRRTPPALAAQAVARLQQAPYHDLRQVSCEARGGVLTLRGRVPTYYLKQIAQTLVFSLEGLLDLRNELDVGPCGSGFECP